MVKYSRMTYEDRCQISAFLQVEKSIPAIAQLLNFHKSTIYREIKRNSSNKYSFKKYCYNPRVAQKKSRERLKTCRRKRAVRGFIEQTVIEKLKLCWSPEQIAGRLRREQKISISHESIYRYVKEHEQYAIYLRWYKRRGIGRYKQRKNRITNLKSIHSRPEIANRRRRIGDWERDCMYGANRKQLLVCTDRKSRYLIIGKLDNALSKTVGEKTMKLLKSKNKKIFSITNDNGPEFRKKIETKVPVFYCDPLKPQQRGTVENTIGLLRRYIKRNTDLDKLHNNDIKYLEKIINKRPRKVLNYLSPYEVFYNKKVALVPRI